MKARQRQKIDKLRAVLARDDLTVSEQAERLGLSRSTAHALLRRDYKNSGLSASVINRMLAAADLPLEARAIIHEYNTEKSEGLYGHSVLQRQKFLASLQETSQPPNALSPVLKNCV